MGNRLTGYQCATAWSEARFGWPLAQSLAPVCTVRWHVPLEMMAGACVSRHTRSMSGSIPHEPFRYGVSTWYVGGSRGCDWETVIDAAHEFSSGAVELPSLYMPTLDGLQHYLRTPHGRGERQAVFDYMSVHGPEREIDDEARLIDLLQGLPPQIASVVMHPGAFDKVADWGVLGGRLLIENMDCRPRIGQTVAELEPFFTALPEAGFCLDVGHVHSIDPSMELAKELLAAFGGRLRQLHVSHVDPVGGVHGPVRGEDIQAYLPILGQCLQVPWILEAPPSQEFLTLVERCTRSKAQ